jgi:hypothetical protein
MSIVPNAAFAIALVVLCSAGCSKSPTSPTQSVPHPDPIPPMSRYDTLYVYLSFDPYLPAEYRWTIATQDTSITLGWPSDGSPFVRIGAIIYDTRDSLLIRVKGWKTADYYHPHELDSTAYVQNYPPQDSTWRLPSAPVDPCKRVPLLLAFSQERYDYEECSITGDCVYLYTLYAHPPRAYYWDTDRGWPAPCSSMQMASESRQEERSAVVWRYPALRTLRAADGGLARGS